MKRAFEGTEFAGLDAYLEGPSAIAVSKDDAEGIKAHLSAYLDELRNSPKAEGKDRIYTHGEKEIFAMEERMKNGIEVNVNTVAEMRDLAQFLGMDVVSYLGEKALNIKGKESLYK